METPTLVEALSAALDSRANQIRTAMPARVISYDINNQIASVRPEVHPDGDEPLIENVPVLWPRGRSGNGYLVMDLEVKTKWTEGDTGLLICCEADITEWLRTGEAGPPADLARHHPQNAVFIPGLVTRGNPLTHFPTTTVLSGNDVRLGDAGATKKAVHEDLLSDMDTFLGLLDTWGGTTAHANWAAATAAFAASVRPALLALRAGIAAAGYISPSVKVED